MGKDICYITIGTESNQGICSNLMEKVTTHIPENSTAVKEAKRLRKVISKHPENHGITFVVAHDHCIKPTFFTWAVYFDKDDKLPAFHSINWLNI